MKTDKIPLETQEWLNYPLGRFLPYTYMYETEKETTMCFYDFS